MAAQWLCNHYVVAGKVCLSVSFYFPSEAVRLRLSSLRSKYVSL
jgi:hypothetical protein